MMPIPTFAFVLAMVASAIGHPHQSRNAETDHSTLIDERAVDFPIAGSISLIGHDDQKTAYDEAIAEADANEVLGKRAVDFPIAGSISLIGHDDQKTAYDEAIAAADADEVLGKRID